MAVIEQDVYTAPLYTKTEAARIVDVPTNTFRNWTDGYWYRTVAGGENAVGLVTLAPARSRMMVPYVGLAEAYVIAALKASGIPMLRIRPAVESLKAQMGRRYALLSENLKTDGVDVLYEFVGDEKERAEGRIGLAAVKDNQLVFREAIEQYLRSVSYEDGYATSFSPKRFGEGLVQVDPKINSGQPSFLEGGIRVEDVSRRVRAGEPLAEVADDYAIALDVVRAVLSRV